MTGVQLIGKGAVLSRYEQLGCESWALFQGKQFIVGGTGTDTLADWLTELERSGTTATYSLRAYDSGEVPISSTANTDYIACIHFKVVDMYEGNGINGRNNQLMDRIKGLEEKLENLNQPVEDGDGGGSIGAIVTDWLENPQKLAVIFGIAKEIFMGASPVATLAQAAPLQSISGFNMDTVNASSEAGLDRISKALDILGRNDPDLVVHLEKLAKLSQEQPALFRAVIEKLDFL